MLANRGIDATSMNGGIDAWNGIMSEAAVGQGMYLLEGHETAEDVIALAYGLEEGTRRFYRDLAGRSDAPGPKSLFETLAAAEVRHEDRLWDRYRSLPGAVSDREAFERGVVSKALEGGLTADQLLSSHPGAFREPAKALGLAMAVETDALDLYLRMGDAVEDAAVQSVFFALAEEERQHLKKLGELRGREP